MIIRQKLTLKSILFVTIFAFSFAMYAQNPMSVDELEKKMEKAVDPSGKLKTTTTRIMTATLLIKQQGISANTIIKSKKPHKSQVISIIPNMMTEVKVFNGETGWVYSNMTGVRQILGAELASIKLQGKMDDPEAKLTEIFQSVTIEKEKIKTGNFTCYKLVCTPKEEDGKNQMTIYVDDEKYLTRQIDMIIVTEMGAIPSITVLEDYKKSNDILFPYKMTSKVLGMDMIVTIDKIELDVPIKDSEFEKSFIDEYQKKLNKK